MFFKNLSSRLFTVAVIAATCSVQVFAAGNVMPPITNSDGDVYGYSYKGPQPESSASRESASASADALPDRAPYEPGTRKNEKSLGSGNEIQTVPTNPQPKAVPGKPPVRRTMVDGIPLPAGAENEEGEGRTTATLTVSIRTIFGKKAVDHIGVYPAPQMPPRMKTEISPLAEDRRSLKQMLLQSGYQDRLSLDHPYPALGYRWHTAFQNALKRAGGGVPHTLLDYYPWINKMVEYVRPEVMKINKKEEARKEAYLKCIQFFQDESRDAESEAVRNNLFPLTLRVGKDSTGGFGRGEVPAGNWWVTVTRKVPGLQLYWQVPVTLEGGQVSNLVLSEDNALWIQGGW